MRIGQPVFDSSLLDIPGTALIDDFDIELHSGRSYMFYGPEDIIVARSPDEVISAFSRLDNCLAEGWYAAGYLAYEAGLVLDKPIMSGKASQTPLAWFGIYRDCVEFDYYDVDIDEGDLINSLHNIRLNVGEDEYMHCIHKILGYIAAGDVYQVNYTCKMLFDNAGTAAGLFARLRNAHPVCHSAFVNAGEFQVASISPELFLRRTGQKLITRPMKGTLRRGRYCDEDTRFADFLKHDEKNRAENVMIVDLMRNDIGRISEIGTVSVPRIFHVERYGSLFQMTSDVEGRIQNSTSIVDLLMATFPPGSITGAPKIRAMEVIEELEREARGVYCGCIGMFRPGGDFLLNVAIRTIVQSGGQCEMGIGGGIVADSDPRAELQEALLKGTFLKSKAVEFRLLETMLYRPGEGYVFLDEHLERVKRSADYFGRRFPEAVVKSTLDKVAADIESSPDIPAASCARVRLLVSRDSVVDVEWTPFSVSTDDHVRLLLTSRRTDPNDIFLYHKTTHRRTYDEDLREAREAGYFDVLYLNERDELTECATTNLVLEIDGLLYTPPLESGLLPGIWREKLLSEGNAIERVLTIDDLKHAARVFIGNSLRARLEVEHIENETEAIWRTSA